MSDTTQKQSAAKSRPAPAAARIRPRPSHELVAGDCLGVMRTFRTNSFALTFTSCPYENARTYGIGYRLKGQAWVEWMIPRVLEACRVTNGLVVVVMSGKVKRWRYQPVVEWLVADLTRYCGLVCGPSPYVFHRVGIPGSGNKHYHRRDWEPVYCFARPEALPVRWSDNTALGHPPKWAPGGERQRAARPSHVFGCSKQMSRRRHGSGKRERQGKSGACNGYANGDTKNDGVYFPPVLANPGNVIHCKVGGNQMGDKLCHENEAPFPEDLAEFFVRSFCPPWGRVLDPFCGSGTTLAVAHKWGRAGVGIDVRPGKGGIDTAHRRLEVLGAMGASLSS